MEEEKSFSAILNRVKDKNLPTKDERYKALALNFNPFPKSGIANIRPSFEQLKYLSPVNPRVDKDIEEYIVATLFAETYNVNDKYMGATVIGDYGSGKTQLLMYVKFLLELVAVDKIYHQNPYVIFIDNPGVKLSELIGKIVSEIGEENFKKFLWNKVLIELERDYKTEIEKLMPSGQSLFGASSQPWDSSNKVNYKKFLDSCLKNFATKPKQKDFEEKMREFIVAILNQYTNDKVVGVYLFKIIDEDLGGDSFWEAMIKGDVKNLAGKEANIIKFIVELLYKEGFTHVYVLVDEFEDITRGRLNKQHVDNYLYSLRTLIDRERNWTIMFAMTQQAFDSLEEASPPLADRISSRKILLNNLSDTETQKILANYLAIARTTDFTGSQFYPFAEDAIVELAERLRGNSRHILSASFKLVEALVEHGKTMITKEMVEEEIESTSL